MQLGEAGCCLARFEPGVSLDHASLPSDTDYEVDRAAGVQTAALQQQRARQAGAAGGAQDGRHGAAAPPGARSGAYDDVLEATAVQLSAH